MENRTAKEQVLLTTTQGFETRRVRDYLGVVNGVAVMGFGVFREFFSGITDIVGGRSKSYQKEYTRALEIALTDLREKAADVGADAVVAIHFDYESISSKGKDFTMVVATGTAIRFAEAADPVPGIIST